MDDSSGSTGTRDPQRIALWLLLAVALLRLVYLVPFLDKFDLVGDEAYYWDWGRRLDWGYYSKPPMIGWLMGIVGRLSGNSEWGIRIAPLILGTLSLLLLQRLTARLFGARAALIAITLAVLTPANAALSLFFTIDAPLVLFWTAALLVFWKITNDPDKPARWVLLTLILGLGHLSKQMMLVFPLLMILYCRFAEAARPLLRRSVFWACILASLLFLLPPILWNASHDWVTFKHTTHHFEAKPSSRLIDHLATFGTFVGLQLLVFSPPTWIILVTAIFGGLRKWRALSAAERFTVIFSAPALAVFTLLSLRQNINPNWPAVYYLTAFALAGAWLDRSALDVLQLRIRRWLKPAAITGTIAVLASYTLPFVAGFLNLEGTTKDPMLRLRGWSEVGHQAGELLEKVPDPKNTFVVALGYRDHASQIAFNTPQHPRVFRFVHENVIDSQYEIWPDPGDEGYTDGDAVIFVPKDENNPDAAVPAPFERQFRRDRELGVVRVPVGNGNERFYRVVLYESMRFWQPPVRRAPDAAGQDSDKPAAEKTTDVK